MSNVRYIEYVSESDSLSGGLMRHILPSEDRMKRSSYSRRAWQMLLE